MEPTAQPATRAASAISTKSSIVLQAHASWISFSRAALLTVLTQARWQLTLAQACLTTTRAPLDDAVLMVAPGRPVSRARPTRASAPRPRRRPPTYVSSRLTDGCLGGSNSVEAEARSSQDRPTALPSSSPIVSGSSRPAGRQQQQAWRWHGGAFAELGVAHSLRLRVRRLDPICNADGDSNRSN